MRCPLAIAAVLFLALAGVAPRAAAQQPDDSAAEAKAHFAKGQTLFAKGDYAEAADEFSQAYAIAPHPKVLLNIALSQDKAGDLVGAIGSYRRYLPQASGTGESESIRKRLAELESQVGEVAVGCAVSPCLVSVDGADQGQAPVSVLLLAGNHVFSVTHAGRKVDEIEIPIRPGDRISVTLATNPAPPPAPKPVPVKKPEPQPVAAPPPTPAAAPPPPEPAAQSKPVPMGVPFWVASSVAAAAGAVTIGFGVKTLDDKQKFEDSGSQDKGLRDQGEQDRLITNIFIGVTAAAGATAAAFAIYEIWFDKDDKESVSLGPGPGIGLAASGRF